jgi:hypothetical protein
MDAQTPWSRLCARWRCGAVWSYEVKRGQNSGEWHPHLHMIALAEVEPSQERLSRSGTTSRDSFVVDVRPIVGDPAEGFMEVFKYAVKFSDQPPADTWHAYSGLEGETASWLSRLLPWRRGAGRANDEPLDDLPYVELFYRLSAWGGLRLSHANR